MPPRTLDINSAIVYGLKTTRANWKMLVPFTFLTIGISSVLGGLDNKGENAISLLAVLFDVIVSISYIHIALRYLDSKSVGIKDLWSIPFERALRYVGSQLLIGFMVLVGSVLFIVPGVYLALRFSQVKYQVIERGSGVWQAMDESGRLTSGVMWSLLGFFIVEVGILVAGICVFVVGILIAMPVVMIAGAHVYRQLTGDEAEVVSEPVLTID